TGTEGDGSSTSGSANDLPTMEAEVDVAAACGQADAMTISFVATRVACAKPPPSPCTLPDPPSSFTGTVIDCPANDVSAALRVGVNQTGRYHVETVLELEDGSELRECYAEGDSIEVIIDDGRLANRPTIEVASMGGP